MPTNKTIREELVKRFSDNGYEPQTAYESADIAYKALLTQLEEIEEIIPKHEDCSTYGSSDVRSDRSDPSHTDGFSEAIGLMRERLQALKEKKDNLN